MTTCHLFQICHHQRKHLGLGLILRANMYPVDTEVDTSPVAEG